MRATLARELPGRPAVVEHVDQTHGQLSGDPALEHGPTFRVAGSRTGQRRPQLPRFVRSSPIACPTPSLRCDVHQHRAAAEVIPHGELDLATTPLVEHQLRQLREAGLRILVLDLRRVTFMDVVGLRLILRWAAAAREDWSRFAVIPGPSSVQRLFAMTATETQVQFVDASGSRSWSSIPPPRRLGGLSRLQRL